MLQKICNEDALSHTQVLEQFGHFKRGQMGVEDHILIGAFHHLETTEIMKKTTRNQRFTIDRISEEIDKDVFYAFSTRIKK